MCKYFTFPFQLVWPHQTTELNFWFHLYVHAHYFYPCLELGKKLRIRTERVWNLRTGTTRRDLDAHTAACSRRAMPMPAFCVRLRLVSGSLKDASAAILKMAAGDTAEKVRPIFFTLEKKRSPILRKITTNGRKNWTRQGQKTTVTMGGLEEFIKFFYVAFKKNLSTAPTDKGRVN
jgi:hypothetical protein